MKASSKDPSKAKTERATARSQTISIAYDREADALSLIFGKPAKAEAEEIGPGVYARYAWQTGRLAEVCIVGFFRRFHKKPQKISVPEYVGPTMPTDKELRQDYLDYLN